MSGYVIVEAMNGCNVETPKIINLKTELYELPIGVIDDFSVHLTVAKICAKQKNKQ